MKRLLAVIMAMVIAVSAGVIFTACSQQTEPKKGIIGTWGGRSDDTEIKFNDDGTCTVGGTNGTYSVDKDNKLSMTPQGGDTETFEWSPEAPEKLSNSQWTINNDKIYINGYTYTKESAASNDNASSNGSTDSNAESVSSSDGQSSAASSNSESNESGDETSMPAIVENFD